MICNKCGKNNDAEAVNCINCGEALPASTNCGGFSDILTYTPPTTSAPEAVAVAQPKGEVLSKEEKKRLEDRAKRGIKFGIFAIILSVLLSACTVYYAYTLSVKIDNLETSVKHPEALFFNTVAPDKNVVQEEAPVQEENPVKEEAPVQEETSEKENSPEKEPDSEVVPADTNKEEK